MIDSIMGSIDSFGHELVEFLIGNFILGFASLFHHQFQHFFIIILTQNLPNLLNIGSSYVSFAFFIVFFEDMIYLSISDFIFRLGGHCCHKFVE